MTIFTKNPNIPLNRIINLIEGYNFNDQIVCVHISPFSKSNIEDGYLSKNEPEKSVKAMGFMIILSGSIEMNIDYIPYKFEENSWVELRPGAKVELTGFSDNISAYLIMATETFIIDTLLDKKPIPVSHYTSRKENPSTILTDYELAELKASYDRIFHYIKRDHHFKKDMLHNTFFNLILEVSNIFKIRHSKKEVIQPQNSSSRRELIIGQFMALVEQNASREHNPSFYSDKLCISTQYLSIILKEGTGKTANYWIAKRLILEAKTLLRTPQTTIKEITSSLNFADQSSFGKFFKKHTGISPKKYREEYAISK